MKSFLFLYAAIIFTFYSFNSDAALDPALSRQGTKLYGNGIYLKQPGGDGLLFGVGFYNMLTNRRATEEGIRTAICTAAEEGYNHFRLFTSLGVPKHRELFVSPWENYSEWRRRRDVLLDAGVECGVYIQLSLFDERNRNDPEGVMGPGYKRSDNSWNGKTPSLSVAKDLAQNVYLAGIDPNSPRGRILLVEHFNEPNSQDWDPRWARDFDQWLKSKGWKFTAGNAEVDLETWGSGDKLELHLYPAYNSWTEDQIINEVKELRSIHGKVTSLSTDGLWPWQIPSSRMTGLAKKCLQNRLSFEMIIGDPMAPWDPDREVKLPNGWKGTTRTYIRNVIASAGLPRRSDVRSKFAACESGSVVNSSAEFFTNLAYQSTLARAAEGAPSSCGHYSGIKSLGLTGIENAGQSMLTSAEFASKYPVLRESAPGVLNLFYQKLLKRSKGDDGNYYDAEAGATYLPEIRGEVEGRDVYSVYFDIVNSAEFQSGFASELAKLPVDRLRKYRQCSGGEPNIEGAVNLVESLYLALLGRKPDLPGACGFEAKIEIEGKTGVDSSADVIVGSSEFATKTPFPATETAARTFLNNIYRYLLKRSPGSNGNYYDKTGGSIFLPILKGEVNGQTPQNVVDAILGSPEFAEKNASSLGQLP